MTKEVRNVLGREYLVMIDELISKLKYSDRMLLGDVVAIVKRSDAILGRPLEDCDASDESGYIVFAPTKYSILCNKEFGIFRYQNSLWRLVSLTYFVEQIVDFNFAYLTVLNSNNILYQTDEFKRLREFINNKLSVDNYAKKACYRRFVSMLIGIATDINSNKFKDENILRNRLFLVYTCVNICNKYMDKNTASIVLPNKVDIDSYNKLVKYAVSNGKITDEASKWMNNSVLVISAYQEKLDYIFNKDKINQLKLGLKAEYMKDIVISILTKEDK